MNVDPFICVIKWLINRNNSVIINIMVNRKFIKIHIVLMSLLLLIGQMSMFKHSIEHLFHTPTELCQSFISYEKGSNGFILNTFELPLIVYFIQPIQKIIDTWFPTQIVRYFLSRAPPSISFTDSFLF